MLIFIIIFINSKLKEIMIYFYKITYMELLLHYNINNIIYIKSADKLLLLNNYFFVIYVSSNSIQVSGVSSERT